MTTAPTARELIDYVQRSDVVLRASLGVERDRLRVLVTHESWRTLALAADVSIMPDPDWFPTQAGKLCGLPVFIRETIEAPAVVQVIEAGRRLDFDMEVPS